MCEVDIPCSRMVAELQKKVVLFPFWLKHGTLSLNEHCGDSNEVSQVLRGARAHGDTFRLACAAERPTDALHRSLHPAAHHVSPRQRASSGEKLGRVAEILSHRRHR